MPRWKQYINRLSCNRLIMNANHFLTHSPCYFLFSFSSTDLFKVKGAECKRSKAKASKSIIKQCVVQESRARLCELSVER